MKIVIDKRKHYKLEDAIEIRFNVYFDQLTGCYNLRLVIVDCYDDLDILEHDLVSSEANTRYEFKEKVINQKLLFWKAKKFYSLWAIKKYIHAKFKFKGWIETLSFGESDDYNRGDHLRFSKRYMITCKSL